MNYDMMIMQDVKENDEEANSTRREKIQIEDGCITDHVWRYVLPVGALHRLTARYGVLPTRHDALLANATVLVQKSLSANSMFSTNSTFSRNSIFIGKFNVYRQMKCCSQVQLYREIRRHRQFVDPQIQLD